MNGNPAVVSIVVAVLVALAAVLLSVALLLPQPVAVATVLGAIAWITVTLARSRHRRAQGPEQ